MWPNPCTLAIKKNLQVFIGVFNMILILKTYILKIYYCSKSFDFETLPWPLQNFGFVINMIIVVSLKYFLTLRFFQDWRDPKKDTNDAFIMCIPVDLISQSCFIYLIFIKEITYPKLSFLVPLQGLCFKSVDN